MIEEAGRSSKYQLNRSQRPRIDKKGLILPCGFSQGRDEARLCERDTVILLAYQPRWSLYESFRLLS